jgi:hypothetical protein
MDLCETRVAIAATLAGLVFATGIGAAATPAAARRGSAESDPSIRQRIVLCEGALPAG